MISWQDRRLLNFKGPPDVLRSPKKRMYPDRNLHYVSHNSVLLPSITEHHHSYTDSRTQRFTDRPHNHPLKYQVNSYSPENSSKGEVPLKPNESETVTD